MNGLLLASLLLAQGPADGAWTHFGPSSGLPEGEVRAVLPDSAGAVWFAVRGGLAVLERGRWRVVTQEDGLVSNGVAGLHEVGGALWAVGLGGYSVREDGRWRAVADIAGRSTRVVFSLTVAPGGTLWLAANGFAARRDPAGWTHFGPEQGLPHAVVHQVWVDRTGAAWFACRRGLARLRDGAVEVFHPEINFRSIVEDRDGRLWFGTGGDGVLAYHGDRWERHLEGRAALPSLVDARGDVWALTEGEGALRWDGRRWASLTTADGLPSDVVYAIAEAADGAIWFGTDRGASRYAQSRTRGAERD